ncbi:hypothetical protein LCGC14_3007730, partial [marine sediment metagenome]
MARLFDSSDNQYLVSTTTPVTAAPVTIACWANSTTITVSAAAMGIFDSGSGTQWLAYMTLSGATAGDPLRAFVRAGGIETLSGGNYAANTWHHLAQRSGSSTDHEAYLDGVSIDTG